MRDFFGIFTDDEYKTFIVALQVYGVVTALLLLLLLWKL